MFITNHLTTAEILSELLDLRGYKKSDTEEFSSLRHDRDLCPAFRERVNAILEAYLSHSTSVHVTQGLRDDGVDVMLTYESDDDGLHKAGLQIKSYKEIDDWANKKTSSFIMNLKAQCAAAVQKVRVDDYYLLICADEVLHKKQNELICSELKD